MFSKYALQSILTLPSTSVLNIQHTRCLFCKISPGALLWLLESSCCNRFHPELGVCSHSEGRLRLCNTGGNVARTRVPHRPLLRQSLHSSSLPQTLRFLVVLYASWALISITYSCLTVFRLTKMATAIGCCPFRPLHKWGPLRRC